MKIHCVVTDADLKDGEDRVVEGVRVECARCGHVTESFGTASPSIKRCLALMKEECPYNEANYYVDENST